MHSSVPLISRRATLGSIAALMTSLAPLPSLAVNARMRVITDNDYGGDVDGLYQLAHLLLSPTTDTRLIIGSHLHANEPGATQGTQAATAAAKVHELIKVLGHEGQYNVVAGTESAIRSRAQWKASPATELIVREAMRTDTDTPLYYTAGGSLTELAIAWLAEPRIGKRLKLVWIGGNEYGDLASRPPGVSQAEYNLTQDIAAAQVIFNQSDIEMWQVPRSTYLQMIIGLAELDELARASAIGQWLKAQLNDLMSRVARLMPSAKISPGETYILGDSPLVTLTALQSFFQPDPNSSSFQLRPTAGISDDGSYIPAPSGRPGRVYTRIDTRLTFGDMGAKIRLAGGVR